jgi:hypothetical protein
MANPPPYNNITGISRAAMKDNAQETLANYNGNARPGELVVNLVTDPPLVYVGNNLGQLTLVASTGSTTWATLGDKNNNNGPFGITLGYFAGQGGQGLAAIAIGANTGGTGQGNSAVAIGIGAGNTAQGVNAVAIGNSAGGVSQGVNSVAMGREAGNTSQGINSVAVGFGAGFSGQGNAAVAVGSQAGVTSQANNSIILNATGSALNQTTANTFTVKPVRAVSGAVPVGFSPMYYNPTTGEIIVVTP